MTDEKNNRANLGFENKLLEMAVKVRGCEDTAEYKHIALYLVLSLARLRDTLLHKLISAGELCIPDAEKLLDRLNINGVHNG